MTTKPNTVYVCQACGNYAHSPYDFNDVSCSVNAVLCLEESLKFDEHGKVTHAEAVKDDQ